MSGLIRDGIEMAKEYTSMSLRRALQMQNDAQLLATRDLIPFEAGDNSTDVIINSRHYNLTTLKQYNFAVYSNATMSNDSFCYLTLPAYYQNMPTIFANGSIVGGASCYTPYYPIGQRGLLGIIFAALFALSILFTLVCLRKHGTLFLQQTKRFRAIGRRWQWYWALFIAACGMIACFSEVDVDRYYLPSAPVIIQVLFWYLSIPATLACVWESVRHWGSWQERQLYDSDPFMYKNHDRRSKIEFWMPLVFYMFAWLNFFMNIPRNWLGFQAQADPSQVLHNFLPAVEDNRFKAGAILAFCAWCMIPLHLLHSIHYYKLETNQKTFGYIRSVPPVFLLTTPLVLVIIGYAAASSWLPWINLGGLGVNSGYIYGLGWAPEILILFLHIASGLRHSNEDLELMQQRVSRAEVTDQLLGIDRRNRKPRWWTHVASDFGFDNNAKLLALVNTNVGHQRNNEDGGRNVQMHELARQHLEDEVATAPHEEQNSTRPTRQDDTPRRPGLLDITAPPVRSTFQRASSTTPSMGSATTAVSQAQPQQIRSMLDV